MFRGTTPTLIFEINADLDLSTLTQIWVTILDCGGHKFTWDITRVTTDNVKKEVTLALTQEETLAFTLGNALVQIRFLTSDDVALTTTCATLNIQDVLKEGVIE